MSNYDFLVKYLSPICNIYPPTYYDDGSFSVLLTDAEDWIGPINIFFDAEGSVIEQ